MAAYAALGTLMNSLEHIHQHPRPPVSLDIDHLISLIEKVTLLQEFLEGHSHGRSGNIELADVLESRIADAAHAAEDVIESHLVDRILAGSSPSTELDESLRAVLEDMDLIKQEIIGTPFRVHPTPRDPARSSSNGQTAVVGFDDVLIEMLDRLTSEEPARQVIPVVGMSGIGKTTLAKTVYSNPLIQHHFDVFAWTAVSHEYCVREILVQVLSHITKEDEEGLIKKSDDDLKVELHKFLINRRYLIVLDDIWDIEVWEEMQLFFPECCNRSRVVITTRLSDLASQLVDGSYCLHMKLLDEAKSWNLFCNVVFGDQNRPLDELEEIGKKIARGCRGLPLTICVVGGLLSKSKYEVEYWEYVAKNVNSVVNSEDNGTHCLKILHLSYIRLPAHLKPCFLYMGVFPEYEKIRVSKVIELWVSEGFLKTVGGKSPEVVAKEYLNELIQRNLVSVHSLGSIGAIKYCNIHDLLRDFCLRQAQKERFENVLMLHDLNTPQGLPITRKQKRQQDRDTRLSHSFSSDWSVVLNKKHHEAFLSMQHACSLYYYSWNYLMPPSSRLLRISSRLSSGYEDYSPGEMFLSKHWIAQPQRSANSSPSTHPYWNFKKLDMYAWMVFMAPSEIWNMPHLKHVRIKNLELPYPPHAHNSVLENLHTLSRVKNFKCSEDIVKRIPNIKKLQIAYTCRFDDKEDSLYNLFHIHRLRTLESLQITYLWRPVFWQKLTFPNSLKKLTIEGFSRDESLGKIGSLPHLVKLKLIHGSFDKRRWVTVEGQFRSLKYLEIDDCLQLHWWETESAHFPRLEHLTLRNLGELKEIPSDIGEIPMLALLHVQWCNSSLVHCANEIYKVQEEQGNQTLQLMFQQL